MSDTLSGAPRLIGVGAVFVDDIVLPDGQTHMGQLGGGVTHALMGAAIWGERPGIVALIGHGLPAEAVNRLEKHFDTRGLVRTEHPQARAWQVFEPDGTRRELYRSEPIMPFITGARPEHLPAEYRSAHGCYLLQGFEGIAAWRAVLDGFVLWEPLQQSMIAGSRRLLAQTLRRSRIDLVSPNLAEARAVYGKLAPEELARALVSDGARAAALRMGPEGSLVADAHGNVFHVAAAPLFQVADQTGAGNAYCGGLLAGVVREKPLQEAAAMGAVAASFCVESIGAIDPDKVAPAECDRRLRAVLGMD